MNDNQIEISDSAVFERNIENHPQFKIENGEILYKPSNEEASKKIASYANNIVTAYGSLDEKKVAIAQLSELTKERPPKALEDVDRYLSAPDLDEKDGSYFDQILKNQNKKYRVDGKKIYLAGSDKEICEYSDGKFTLTNPDDETLQAVVDMLHASGVKKVAIFPDKGHVADTLTKMFETKGIEVNNLSAARSVGGKSGPLPIPPQERENDRYAASHVPYCNDGQSPKTIEEALKTIREIERSRDIKEGQGFSGKFASYDVPSPDGYVAFFRKELLGRHVSGMSKNGLIDAKINDHFRNSRIEGGSAFEVHPKTLAMRLVSEERSAIKGMVKFAIAARANSNEKLKFNAKNDQVAKHIAQEVMKQGISLDDVEIKIDGKAQNFKLSLADQALTESFMSTIGRGKYKTQREELDLESSKSDTSRFDSGFDPTGVMNRENSRIAATKGDNASKQPILDANKTVAPTTGTPRTQQPVRSLSFNNGRSLGSP
jgi:hypothetical protein